MLSVRKAAPARMSAIMQYSRVPPSSDSLKVCHVSDPCTAEIVPASGSKGLSHFGISTTKDPCVYRLTKATLKELCNNCKPRLDFAQLKIYR